MVKWYRRHCNEYPEYNELFSQVHFEQIYVNDESFMRFFLFAEKHEITGCALLRLSDSALERMGIENNHHREAIWREIVKQRLKTDIMEMRDMERDLER